MKVFVIFPSNKDIVVNIHTCKHMYPIEVFTIILFVLMSFVVYAVCINNEVTKLNYKPFDIFCYWHGIAFELTVLVKIYI